MQRLVDWKSYTVKQFFFRLLGIFQKIIKWAKKIVTEYEELWNYFSGKRR